jgi:hypothetical protein
MAHTATLNWEIQIGVPGLGVFWEYYDTMVTCQQLFGCLSNFKEVLKDTGFFKSTKSVPMAGFYYHFLENPGWRMAACITMEYRRLTDHQNELQGEAYSWTQLMAVI